MIDNYSNILTEENNDNQKEWHKIMMERFNKLNEEYNSKNNEIFKNSLDFDIENKLKFNHNDVFEILSRANNDMNLISKNIEIIDKKINNYKLYKQKIEELNNMINKTCELHRSLCKDINDDINILSNIGKLCDEFIINHKINISLDNLNSQINIHLEELSNEKINNYNKALIFKKLVLNCIKFDSKKNYKNICTICLSNKINVCLNACGHTFCSSCTDMMNNKCGLCRSTILSKIKIFIDDNDDTFCTDENTNDYDMYDDNFNTNNINNDNLHNNNVNGILGFNGFYQERINFASY